MTSTKKTLDASKYDTDKAAHTHYLRNYEEYFRPLLERDIRLLELGVYHGGSLLLWRDYFARGLVVGLDINPVHIEDPTGRVRVYQGQQQDTELLDRIARETAPEGFDVIIDDCAHVGHLARASFRHLFDRHRRLGHGLLGLLARRRPLPRARRAPARPAPTSPQPRARATNIKRRRAPHPVRALARLAHQARAPARAVPRPRLRHGRLRQGVD